MNLTQMHVKSRICQINQNLDATKKSAGR